MLALTGAIIFGLPVASTANDVRPWKALTADSMRVRPVLNDASLRAFSFIYHGVAVKAERVKLFGDFLYIMGMAMTYAYDGVAAVKV